MTITEYICVRGKALFRHGLREVDGVVEVRRPFCFWTKTVVPGCAHLHIVLPSNEFHYDWACQLEPNVEARRSL